MFTYEDDAELDPEEIEYYCTICKGRLDYLGDLEEWFCTICNQHYDTRIQDKPLKNMDEYRLHSHHDPYRQYDENDPYLPFIDGIDVDDLPEEPEEVEIVRSSADQRIKHIRVKGNIHDALSATREV